MSTKLGPFDATKYLDSPEAIAAYIGSAMEDGTDAEIADAMGEVARAIGMSEIAKRTGLARPALYRSLSETGSPEFATVRRVLKSFGLELHVTPAGASAAA